MPASASDGRRSRIHSQTTRRFERKTGRLRAVDRRQRKGTKKVNEAEQTLINHASSDKLQ